MRRVSAIRSVASRSIFAGCSIAVNPRRGGWHDGDADQRESDVAVHGLGISVVAALFDFGQWDDARCGLAGGAFRPPDEPVCISIRTRPGEQGDTARSRSREAPSGRCKHRLMLLP